MLSVLIPTYAYSALPLVKNLQEQFSNLNISYEILCFDNGSKSKTDLENQKINDLENCQFKALENNGGRSKIRNTLAEEAKYDYLLFLDADVLPVSNQFVKNYCTAIQNYKPQVVFGGLKYQDEKPQKNKMLRWVFGKSREEISLKIRNKNPSFYFTSANFLIAKNTIQKHPFNEELTKYGYEDALLALELKKYKIEILQLDNPVYHLGLDENSVFVDKTEKAVENIYFLHQTKVVDCKSNRLLLSFYWVKILQLGGIISFIFKKCKERFKANLLSSNPSLFIYDCYKLGYICSLDKK